MIILDSFIEFPPAVGGGGGGVVVTSWSGARIPDTMTAIGDSSNNTWTLAGGVPQQNGAGTGITGVVLILWWIPPRSSTGTLYSVDGSNVIRSWNGSSWVATSGWVYIAAGSSIQTAINNNATNTNFIIQAGVFSEAIVPKAGIALIGAGIGRTVLNGNGTIALGFSNANSVTGVTISGITVRHFTDQGTLINTGSTVTWVIDRCEYCYNNDHIRIGTGVTLSNNLFHDSQFHSLHLTGNGNALSNNVITNNEVYSNNTSLTSPFGTTADAGWKWNGGGGEQITNNKIHESYGNGIWFDSNCEGATVSGNEIYKNYPGNNIAVEIGADNGVVIWFITGNYIHDCNGAGIQFGNSGYANVTGNAFEKLTGGGVNFGDEGNRGTDHYTGLPLIEQHITTSGNWIAAPSTSYLAFKGTDAGFQDWKAQNNSFSSNTYYLATAGQAAWNDNGTLETFTTWKGHGASFDTSGSTVITTSGGNLPAATGPRGNFAWPWPNSLVVPSPDGGAVITPSNGSFMDTYGITWTVTAGNQMAKNGVTDTGTANVTLALYYNNTVYHENASTSWFWWNVNLAVWSSRTAGDPRTSFPNH